MCRKAVKQCYNQLTNQNVFEHKIEVIMSWQICIEALVPVWIPGVDITHAGLPFWEHVLKCWKKGSNVQFKLFVVGTLKLFSSKDIMRKPYCLCKKKKKKKLERICEHESSSKVANIHVSLQFGGETALKRRITLSYKYQASEEKIHFVPFSPTNINSRVNRWILQTV